MFFYLHFAFCFAFWLSAFGFSISGFEFVVHLLGPALRFLHLAWGSGFGFRVSCFLVSGSGSGVWGFRSRAQGSRGAGFRV